MKVEKPLDTVQNVEQKTSFKINLYRIGLKDIREFYKNMKQVFKIKSVFKLTNEGEKIRYPYILVTGYTDGVDEVYILKIGRWHLRLWHEIGHLVGFDHSYKIGDVMFPTEIGRGYNGITKIKEKCKNEQTNN